MNAHGDAIVGSELIHLYEPAVSQSMLVRLDPFTRALPRPQMPTNYHPGSFADDALAPPLPSQWIDTNKYTGYSDEDRTSEMDITVPYR